MQNYQKIIAIAALGWTATVMQARLSYAQATTSDVKQAVLAELTSKLDTKSAKVGDVVSAKTVAELKQADGSTIRKGSKLTGKVTEVESKSAGNGMVSVAIIFDQLEVKGEPQKPIHGILVAIAPRPSLSDQGASSGSLPLGSTKDVGTMAAATGGGPVAPGGQDKSESMQPGSTVKGVKLDTKLTADGSSVLHGSDKEIHLESGMKIQVGLM
jgi:hypothetical protein